MRTKSPWLLFAAIFGASFLCWKLALEPHARSSGELERAPATAQVDVPPAPRATAPARADATPSAAPTEHALPPSKQRVRVVVRLAADASAVAALGAELLRVDERGREHAVACCNDPLAPAPVGPRELAELLRAQRALPEQREATQRFELAEGGRYAIAWHAWRHVPGTLTWRTARGAGEVFELRSPFTCEERTLELVIAPEQLSLDPALDAPVIDAVTHVTAKDG
ncbi:MAG: hypothetical protein IPN34_19730 [Planctomycetes bacterium]|nr:hypothetical protein [Planctomycetota bacterium]